ncbi:MAG: hypothetical protein V4638_05460 [Bacteroidota bacterium]
MAKFFLYSFIVVASLSSCVKNNPDPSWLEVTAWTLEANSELNTAEGQLTHNISEAWVYVDDAIVGVFEVPFKIPILKSGNVNIKIYPAVKNNGIASTKKMYPFLEFFEINTTLTQNQTLLINPTTKYKSNCTFYIEDFEDAQVNMIDDNDYAAGTLYVDNDPTILQSFNEGGFGRVDLDNSIDTNWLSSTNFSEFEGSDLPRGQDVYLELDFYNTNEVLTGLLAVTSSSSLQNWNVQLNAQSDTDVKWKHIYIDLKELIGGSSSSALFQQIFRAKIDEGDTQGLIVIDNLKIVHF